MLWWWSSPLRSSQREDLRRILLLVVVMVAFFIKWQFLLKIIRCFLWSQPAIPVANNHCWHILILLFAGSHVVSCSPIITRLQCQYLVVNAVPSADNCLDKTRAVWDNALNKNMLAKKIYPCIRWFPVEWYDWSGKILWWREHHEEIHWEEQELKLDLPIHVMGKRHKFKVV